MGNNRWSFNTAIPGGGWQWIAGSASGRDTAAVWGTYRQGVPLFPFLHHINYD
jgi:hypothetical protein